MPTYGSMGYGSFPYMQQPNYQGGVQPNFMPNNNQFQQPQLNQYAFVNGIEGAKAFQVQPNQTMLLMDNDNPICYMKQSNNMGQSTLRYFKLTEISEQELKGGSNTTNDQFVLKTDFDTLKSKVDQLITKLAPERHIRSEGRQPESLRSRKECCVS